MQIKACNAYSRLVGHIGDGNFHSIGQGVEVMVAIKKALDPFNILNPGKIFTLL